MADYIYLLDTRLSEAQKRALSTVREVARAKGLTVFLVGGAVRDLTGGSPVRDLDIAIQGNALKLKKDLQKAGAVVTGEMEALQSLFVRFPGKVRMEVGSTLSATYPKPGKPTMKPATILDDLRRRDFTANAMALSLNEGSYGLLMDPLNGVADIENRELRLVSNYGFIEEPVRLVRAARFSARLGWQLEEKTLARYQTGKAEGYIAALQSFHRGYEAEEIVHEEDPLRVMRRLEQEGWLKRLVPTWGAAKVNVAELEKLREIQTRLQMQGIHADPAAAQFPLLTAKMAPKDAKALKKSFPRQGFVTEIEALEGEAKRLAAELGSKQAAKPSATWKLLMSAPPETVLWIAYSTKNTALQAKFQSFYTEWPQARQKIPYTQMQEMRIVPNIKGFDELVEKVFYELIDGRLGTEEEMKAFLEPYSPPAPPPTVHLRRARAPKKDAKAKARKKSEAVEIPAEESRATDDSALVVGVAAASGEPAVEAVKGVARKPERSKEVAPKAATKPHAPARTALPAKTVVSKTDAAKAAPVKVALAKTVANKAVARKASPTKVAVVKAKFRSAVKAHGKTAAKSVAKSAAKSAAKAVAVKPKTKPGAKSAAKKAAKAARKPSVKAPAKSPAKSPAKHAPARKR